MISAISALSDYGIAAIGTGLYARSVRPIRPSASAQPLPGDPLQTPATAPEGEPIEDRLEISEAGRSAAAQRPADELTDEEKEQVERLRKRDAEVRQHERAHKAAAGRYARGAPRYTYQRGPDGRLYAVEGEVPIDLSPVPGDPAATIRKMQIIQRAANAPAQPSAADRQIAAEAARIEQQARAELRRQQAEQESQPTRPADTPAAQPGQLLDLVA